MVQDPFAPVPLLARAGIDPPVRVRLEAPGFAVRVDPTQVVDAVGGVAMISCWLVDPIGNGSVKLRPVIGAAEILVSVMVRVETVPSNAAAGVNPLPTVTTLATGTLEVPVEGPELVAPPVATTPPAAITLFSTRPGAAPIGVMAQNTTVQTPGEAPTPDGTVPMVKTGMAAVPPTVRPTQPAPLRAGAAGVNGNSVMPVGS